MRGWLAWICGLISRGRQRATPIAAEVKAPEFQRWYRVEDSQSIPPHQVLRVWVALTDGRELELHASYDPQEGWDFPLGLRWQIAQVKAWQLIDSPNQPLSSPSVVGPRQHPQELIYPELREFLVLPRLLLIYRLADRYRQDYFMETGEVLEEEQVVTWQPDYRTLSRKLREAFLWLCLEYRYKPIELGAFDHWPTGEDLDKALLQLVTHIQCLRTQELHLLYYFLSRMRIRGEAECYRCIQRLRHFAPLVERYSNDSIHTLYQVRQMELRALWEHYRDEWIQRFGSPVLRYGRQHGHEIDILYVQERLEQEFPGFQLVTQDVECLAKMEVSPAEHAVLRHYPQGDLVFLRAQHHIQTGIFIPDFLGEYRIFLPLEGVQLPQTQETHLWAMPEQV